MNKELDIDFSNLVDLINIKNLPEIICDYFKDNYSKDYNNLRKFYSRFFDYFDESIKDSYLNRILKYLSTDKESDILFIDDINDDIYDKELLLFSEDLANSINQLPNSEIIYEDLNSKINIFFYGNEYSHIIDLYNNKEYKEFIFLLFKHAFSNYKNTLPGIFSKRIFEEALTLNPNCAQYIKSLNAASYLGNDDATYLLYSIITIQDKNLATEILLRSKENEKVLWDLGFSLENSQLNRENIEKIKTKYDYIFSSSDDFVDKIKVVDRFVINNDLKGYKENMKLAFKLYYYSSNKYGFTKAINSIGKLFIFDRLSYIDRKTSIMYGKKYLDKAIKMGNIYAFTNMAVYCYNNKDYSEYDFPIIRKMLKTAASVGDIKGSYYYGKILFDEGKYSDGLEYLEYASECNNGAADLLLGNYYELQSNYEKAIEYYKIGILNKYYDCAYYLAILYLNFNINKEQKNNLYINIANDYLNKYYDLFSEEIRKKAKLILEK